MADEAREMAELVFDLQYDGPALQTHEMNVRDLAPALVATAELFQEMNRLARPTDPDISVNVRATGEGSFLVELKLFYEASVGMLGSVDATALVNLGTLLHWLRSLISLRRKRSASAITSQDEPDEEGLVRVTFADATELEVPAAVLQFDRNVTIRQNLSEIVKPLGREGVDVVRVQQNELLIGEITEPEMPAFLDTQVEPSEREELLVTEGEKWLEIISPVFQRDYSWGTRHCLQLWNDVVRVGSDTNANAHFVGSVVLVLIGKPFIEFGCIA